MKTINSIILAAAIVLGAASAAYGRDDWARFARYEQANRDLRAAGPLGHRVVFMGNSITDFWVRDHPSFFAENGFVGRGIAGQTSYQFLSRFREDVINLQPQVVVINAAINDIAENSHPYDEDRTFGNIMSMVELARANGITVVLTSTLPAADIYWNKDITDVPAKIQSFNRRLRRYADDNGIAYVDYYSAMVTPDGALDPAFTHDGLHPNPAGYDIMETCLMPVLSTLLR